MATWRDHSVTEVVQHYCSLWLCRLMILVRLFQLLLIVYCSQYHEKRACVEIHTEFSLSYDMTLSKVAPFYIQ